MDVGIGATEKVNYVLSADVGSGKTTFLRWLCCELLDKTDNVLPVFMTCEEAFKHENLVALRSCWISELEEQFLTEDLAYTFDAGTSLYCAMA